MRNVLIVLAMLVTVPQDSSSDRRQALEQAQAIWGPDAWISKEADTYKAGCVLNQKLLTVASAKGSWAEAFNQVNMGKNGKHVVTAMAWSHDGSIPVQSPPIIVYLCNP